MDSTSEHIEIIRARNIDASAASSIMQEAALRLKEQGQELWLQEELEPEHLIEPIAAGELYLVRKGGILVGTVLFQLEDPEYWPDMPPGEAAYVHKLILKTGVAGTGAGREVIAWARATALESGRTFLRLDCEACRDRLCAYYEAAGFVRHSERQVGRHRVARYEMRLK